MDAAIEEYELANKIRYADQRKGHNKANFLLIFMRYPQPGRVKTRLAREIGAERAAVLYTRTLRRTLGIASDLKHEDRSLRIIIFCTPGDPLERLEKEFGGPWTFYPQEGEHLGVRMENAFETAFSMGAGKAVLIGSDIVDIRADDLVDSFKKTQGQTAVLGPARDGGFYLIGLARSCGAPFRFSEWGTADVFSRAEGALANSGMRVATVARRSDLDRPEDIPLTDSDPLLGKSLSVIIPTLHQPEKLSPLIEFLQNRLWPGDEIVVTRGMRSGEIGVISRQDGFVAGNCPTGRGIQQNFGAMLARGDILFFLHDDTIPPADFPYLIRKACCRPDMALGFFRLAFCPTSPALNLIARWANVRSRIFKLPYGDQGLFCRKDVFEKAGGFHHRFLFEDVDLVRHCRKLGSQAILPHPVYSSPERYLRKGTLAASFQNHFLTILHLFGVDEAKLYSMYYR